MNRKILLLIIVLLLIFFFSEDLYKFVKNVSILYNFRKDKETLVAENQKLSLKVMKLKDENSREIELLIREKLYYCKPGEYEVHFNVREERWKEKGF